MKCQIMKLHALLFNLSLLTIPMFAYAGWEVARPANPSREPFFQASVQPGPRRVVAAPVFPAAASPRIVAPVFPNQSVAMAGRLPPVYAVSISGSLKENIERIMGRYHWKVVWKSPYDYNFDGRVTGSSLPNVVEKILQPFPLQAVMYMSNRTIAIEPRARYKS
jgi:hypothetical protein